MFKCRTKCAGQIFDNNCFWKKFSLKIETIGSEALPDTFQGLQWPAKWSQLCIYTMQWLETQQHLLKSKFKKICCTKIWNSTATSPPKKRKWEILPVLPSFLVGFSHNDLKLTGEGWPEALLMCFVHCIPLEMADVAMRDYISLWGSWRAWWRNNCWGFGYVTAPLVSLPL